MQRVEFCINEIREIKNHFYGKRQTANVKREFVPWRSFPVNCRLLYITSVSTQN